MFRAQSKGAFLTANFQYQTLCQMGFFALVVKMRNCDTYQCFSAFQGLLIYKNIIQLGG